MSRRWLEACLLAYPRACRQRDREHLRDLALDLGETHGMARQAISLLLGGLKERIEGRRGRARRSAGRRVRRAAIACFALSGSTALAFALVALAGGDLGGVRELEEYTCASARACADTSELVAVRQRQGWSCTTSRLLVATEAPVSWECRRG